MNLEKIYHFAKETLIADASGHDWEHALRVEKNVLEIIPEKLPTEDIEIVRAAAWLHDTIDDKVEASMRKSVDDVVALLEASEATTRQLEEIVAIIQHISYAKNLQNKQMLSTLGKIVQDADRLDAIGAIGIARAFYYGGHKGQPLYDDTRPRNVHQLTEEDYRNGSTVINHFYEKLLLLEQSMHTTAGITEAIKRTRFMREFLEQFYNEIDQ